MTVSIKRLLFIGILCIIGVICSINISLRLNNVNSSTDNSNFGSLFYLAASVRTVSTAYGKYSTRRIKTPLGSFRIRFITANLANPKVNIATDTSTSTKCKNNCPTKPLYSYYKRNRGFAAINGTYYCPYDYASCRGKTGFWFWRVFNTRRHIMINQSNGFTRHDPLMVFDVNKKFYYFRHAEDFIKVPDFEKTYQTKVRAAIAGTQLVYKKKIAVPKRKLDSKQKYTKANRGAFGIKGTTVYLVVANSATVIDMASIMKALKVDYAINLDGGGSSALLFHGKYRIGPGRNLVNAIILTKQ